jgi:hypothetical protein
MRNKIALKRFETGRKLEFFEKKHMKGLLTEIFVFLNGTFEP